MQVYPRVCGEAPRQVDIRKPPSFPKGIPHLYYTKYNTDVYNGGLVVLVDAVTIAWTGADSPERIVIQDAATGTSFV